MSEETHSPRGLTIADLDFLTDLQREMNTQDTLGQRDPRFWVIMDYDYRTAAPDEAPGYVLEVTDGCGYARYSIAELRLAAYEDVLENDGEEAAAEWLEDMCVELVTDPVDGTYTLASAPGFDLERICESYFSPRCSQWVHQVKEPHIAANTMFLTQAAASAHLAENRHHYDESAHTYAMTAWRSPQVERLYGILHEVDFRALRCLLDMTASLPATCAAMDALLDEAKDGKAEIGEELLGAATTALFFVWNATRPGSAKEVSACARTQALSLAS